MTDTEDYVEENPQLSVTYTWKGCRIIKDITTEKGTRIEMVDRPVWGLSCFMDKVVQSCELDEHKYHGSFVLSGASLIPKGTVGPKICIFGGGEGALARDVFHYLPTTESVHMIEWDRGVVDLFQQRFQQWARGAWEDPRLTIQYEDAFSVCKEERTNRYDMVLVDLFDIEEDDLTKWKDFIRSASGWSKGSFAMYIGTQAPFVKTNGGIPRKLRRTLKDCGFTTKFKSFYVPSFQGYAVFLLGKRET
jgi:spermidine synthase